MDTFEKLNLLIFISVSLKQLGRNVRMTKIECITFKLEEQKLIYPMEVFRAGEKNTVNVKYEVRSQK